MKVFLEKTFNDVDRLRRRVDYCLSALVILIAKPLKDVNIIAAF